MKRARAIHSIFFRYALIIFTIFVTALGLFLVAQELNRTQLEIERHEASFVRHQKELLENQVNRVYHYIEYMRSTSNKPVDQLQEEILNYIATIRFGQEGYVFVNTYEGIPLIRDGLRIQNGESIWDLTDPNGVKVIQDEYRAATTPGGGFFRYSWRRLHSEEIAPKLSFVRGIDDWRWMFGAGLYLDDIKPDLIRIKSTSLGLMKQKLLQLSLAFLVVLALIIYFSRRMGHKLGTEFETMSRYFRQRSTNIDSLTEDRLRVSEFRQLAADVNLMMDERTRLEATVRESEAKFRQLFEQSADAMSILAGEGFVDHNQSLVDMFGAKTKEELYVSPLDLSPEVQPDGRPSDKKARDVIRKAYMDGNIRFEWMHRRLNGELFWCEIVLTRIPWEGEDSLFVVWRDISRRKRAEMKLRESESSLKKSQEMAHVGNWELDLENRSFSVSEEVYQIYGYGEQPQQINFERVRHNLIEEDRERVENALRNLILHDEPYNEFFRIRRESDNKVRYIHSRGEAHRDSDGKCTRVVGVVQDITTMKELELQALEERERLAVTIASIADGILVTDAEHRVTMMNPVCETYTGVQLQQDESRSLNNVLQFENLDDQQMVQPDQIPEEGVLVSRAGQHRQVLISRAPVMPTPDKILGHVLVIRDVTRFRQMENELQKAQRLESLGALAGGIAHDFNNQLTGITGNLSLVRHQLDSDNPVLKLIGETERAAEACKGLTNQLLTFSTGGEPITAPMDLAPLIQETARFVLRGKPVEADVQLSDEPVWVNADEAQLRQVFSNLLINATNAMSGPGRIQITLEKTGQEAIMMFTDSGPGIPESIRDQVFDPFFTTRDEGTGLGLAIAHSIMTRHGGTIELVVNNKPGATFRLRLPLGVPAHTEQEPVPLAQQSRPVNILVMDDEPFIRELAVEMLEFLGNRVAVAANGAAAIEAYVNAMESADPFDMIILDVTVPGGMGGPETLTEIRKLDPGVMAVVTSGYSSDPLLADFRSHGFVNRLEKPFSIDQVRNVINQVLETIDRRPS